MEAKESINSILPIFDTFDTFDTHWRAHTTSIISQIFSEF